jgi:hypothetical protein
MQRRSKAKTTYRKYKESAHVSLLEHPISQPSLDISPIWTPIIASEVNNYNSVQHKLSGKIGVFNVGTIHRIYLSSDDFYSDSTLVLGQYMCEVY